MYHLEITRFRPDAISSRTDVSSASEAAAMLSRVDDETCVLFVAHLEGHLDHGNFYVWLRAGSALVRLDEHREHYASTVVASGIAGDAFFLDEDGSEFSVPFTECIDRAMAFRALEHWLTTGQKTPELLWS